MIINSAKAAEAAKILMLDLEGLTREKIVLTYRTRAKDCHPDLHGDEKLDDWARLGWARECLLHWLTMHKNKEEIPIARGEACITCSGTGRVNFRHLAMWCATCRGTGVLEPQEDDHD